MITVEFATKAPGVTAAAVKKAVRAALDAEGKDLELGVVVVDDAAIRRVNREFLAHDFETDVIAFDLRGGGPGQDGEIYVSVDTAAREGADRGHGLRRELLLYCIHGTLHLLGYDDKRPAARRRMHARQEELLESVCPTPPEHGRKKSNGR